MSYRDRFRKLSEVLKEKNNEDLIVNIGECIKLCGEYVYKVNNLESAFITANLVMESKEYREYANMLDEVRHNTHENLILSVKLINKLCNMVSVEPVYQGDIEKRVEIGDFAQEVVAELFKTRII